MFHTAEEDIISQEDELAELLTTKEVAEYLKLKPVTVTRKAAKGEIPAIKIGGRFRFDKGQIDGWLHHRSTSGKNILVVDDEETIRQLFKDTLESRNCRVVTAQNSIEALGLVRSWSFDLIFMALKMPGVNGADTFRQIRQIDSSVPVIIITGYPISDLMEQVMEHGPFGIMKKPFNALDIQRSADSFLRGMGAKDKLTEGFQRLGYMLR